MKPIQIAGLSYTYLVAVLYDPTAPRWAYFWTRTRSMQEPKDSQYIGHYTCAEDVLEHLRHKLPQRVLKKAISLTQQAREIAQQGTPETDTSCV